MSALEMSYLKINRRLLLRGAIAAVPMATVSGLAAMANEGAASPPSDFETPSNAPGWKGNGVYEMKVYKPEYGKDTAFFWIDRYICRNEDTGKVSSLYSAAFILNGHKIAPRTVLPDGALEIVRKVENPAECERLLSRQYRHDLGSS